MDQRKRAVVMENYDWLELIVAVGVLGNFALQSWWYYSTHHKDEE